MTDTDGFEYGRSDALPAGAATVAAMPADGNAVCAQTGAGISHRAPQTHQPDQAAFRAILPEDIEWRSFPAFPPQVRLAVLVGHPAESGPYVIRVKVPDGTKLMPHRHPEDRIYTVMSGVFYIGLGEEFDGDKVTAYPPASVVVLPGDTWHFHWAKSGEYIAQVTAIGPLGLEYRNADDDPRKQNRAG
jgi:quercetin dioxygenase-like cupin family protein